MTTKPAGHADVPATRPFILACVWHALDADSLPDPETGPFLCTNNIDARNARGRMSHVFLTHMFHKTSGPEGGPITALDASSDRKIWGVTHYQRIEAPDTAVGKHLAELMVAARIVAFEDQSPEALRRLDLATEKFADLIPWEDAP